jgi:hypothetical protein
VHLIDDLSSGVNRLVDVRSLVITVSWVPLLFFFPLASAAPGTSAIARAAISPSTSANPKRPLPGDFIA